MSESPQQQAPNSEMASFTCVDPVIHLEQTVPEQHVPEQVFDDQPFETNTTFDEPEISTNDQPSSSNLAIQTCAPARTTNIPSPPTLFLDSTILAYVCENIFQELNKLVLARNNLIYEESYEKKWR